MATKFLNLDTDPTMAANSDSLIPSQKAVKTALATKQNAGTAVRHTESTAVGSSTQPVYIASDGTATATSYSLNKSVPADAVFTDTTYSAFVGTDGTTAGTAGLVPAPTIADASKFLKGDGTWTTVSGGGGSVDIEGKADVDLSNVNASGISLASGWAMPSNTYDILTLGASGTTYSAPANGYFYLGFVSGGLSYYGLQGSVMKSGLVCQAANYESELFLPVKKGEVVTVVYQIAPSSSDFKFVYAEGEENVQSN